MNGRPPRPTRPSDLLVALLALGALTQPAVLVAVALAVVVAVLVTVTRHR